MAMLTATELDRLPDLYHNRRSGRDNSLAISGSTTPEAVGKRFCCAIEHAWMSEVAAILDKHFAERGYKIPTRKLPDFLVRIFALFDKPTRIVVNDLGKRQDISNARIKELLGWQPRSLAEMVVSMGESMIEQGVV